MALENSQALDQYFRAANYLTVAQIFLKDNFLLERPLTFDDIKPRLLGHWGSGPGVNFAYMHLSQLSKKTNQQIMFVLGPGHAFPSLQANLFLEGTLEQFYPQAQRNLDGIAHICQNFSWPYGFPSHSNPGTPGVILEGGELGYSLSTSYGAALDNPDLMVATLVGDGEAETGPTAAAWHINKLVDPKQNGNVLPIVHLNGYKISGPTIYGRMSDNELLSLFRGYGYQPRIVSGDNLNEQMQDALEWAYHTIQDIKHNHHVVSPRMPMLIMRTLKGWTGVKEINGNKIEGNALSHQVVLMEAKTDQSQLRALEEWLKSYKFNELFNKESGFGSFVEEIFPAPELRMGVNKHAHGGESVYKPLVLPEIERYAEDAPKPGTIGSSSMRRMGLYLSEVFKLNKESKNFRMMSPDETYSNKVDDIFVATKRAWVWPIMSWDKDLAHDGRVMEMLSEHSLQGIAQGYVLTGRHSVFVSYEAFIQVVASMMDQYAKFVRHAREIEWRGDFPSFNYILTSSGWRQDHNGFSHQNPGFINDVLRRHGDYVTVYFPPDGNAALAVLERSLASKKEINVICAAKTVEPRWMTPDYARQGVEQGAMVWDFASDEDPQVVFSAAGEYMVKEALAAISIIKQDKPDIRLRFVNIMALTAGGIGTAHNKISVERFEELYTVDKPVIFNYHGYPETLKAIVFDYLDGSDSKRVEVHGYVENGSTTTPFDMHVRNQTSRYDLVISAYQQLARTGQMSWEEANSLIDVMQQKIAQNTEYIKHNGLDLEEIDAWQWTRTS
ncbi:MAG: xylulose-5-phosphate/fructose-6-phosphate phosphoketolase [Patescibacteria group bacterium]|nr:xylulose-5-phosphate/fructose-6-phosphate phosphoketolase [Patescibacteria group bacterium]